MDEDANRQQSDDRDKPGEEGVSAQRRRRQTLVDVATRAGVSTATVSRAFSRPFLLREDTMQRILKIADELGYSPNGAGRALVTGKFGTLAMIVPSLMDPAFPPLVHAVQEHADTLGLALVLGDSNESPTRELSLIGRLSAQADGIVLANTQLKASEVQAFGESKATVLIDADVQGVSAVLVDVQSAITEVLRHLVELGHRTIAFASPPDVTWLDEQCTSAIESFAERHRVRLDRFVLKSSSLGEGRAVVRRLVPSGATAVIVRNDLIGNGVLSALKLRDVSVPRDITIVSLQEAPTGLLNDTFTGVSLPTATVGRSVVELLVRVESDDSLPEQRVVVPAGVSYRWSSGPVPSDAGIQSGSV